MEVKIEDVDPETGIGEIHARGPNVMLGYYNDEETTAETIGPEGWLATGDLGMLDEQGNLHIKGRCKNIIVMASGESSVDTGATYEAGTEGALDIDPMLLKIYHDESQGHIETVRQLLGQGDSVQVLADKNLMRAFHTLYGSARTAEIDAIAESLFPQNNGQGDDLDTILLVQFLGQVGGTIGNNGKF